MWNEWMCGLTFKNLHITEIYQGNSTKFVNTHTSFLTPEMHSVTLWMYICLRQNDCLELALTQLQKWWVIHVHIIRLNWKVHKGKGMKCPPSGSPVLEASDNKHASLWLLLVTAYKNLILISNIFRLLSSKEKSCWF